MEDSSAGRGPSLRRSGGDRQESAGVIWVAIRKRLYSTEPIDLCKSLRFVNCMSNMLRALAGGAAVAIGAVLLPTPAQAATAICNRYCDGRDAALPPADRQPVSSTLYG